MVGSDPLHLAGDDLEAPGDQLEGREVEAPEARPAAAFDEDRLNEEVREVLVQHTDQMDRSDITYSEMFKKVKRELAKQKGIIL